MKLANGSPLQKAQYANMWARLRVAIVGIAQDFWKDPPPHPESKVLATWGKTVKDKKFSRAERAKQENLQPRWHASRVDILEKIWGEGMARPGDASMLDSLLVPLGLNREMNVLDLAAGFGGLARKIASDYQAYVAGMEIDADIARRGMQLSVMHGKAKHASIEHYDPENFVPPMHYDCFIARDIFYRVADREKFFKSIALGIKPRGQLSFMDFILEADKAQNPEVLEWLAHDKGANPLSLAGMTGEWGKLGFEVRVNEDQTKPYHAEIVKGLARFSAFLQKNIPDDETKHLVKNEIEKWGFRAKALEHGLQYCRFYAIKN